MRISWFVSLGLLSLLVIAAGCSVQATVSGPGITGLPSSCALDTGVVCGDGATGYSCTSTDSPDQADSSIACSVPLVEPGGLSDYCCLQAVTFPAGTCGTNAAVTCPTAGSYGFSCASTDTPDQTDSSLTCSAGVAGSGGNTDFCCTSGIVVSGGSSSGGTIIITAGCSTDSTVTGCSSPSTGYSCTGTTVPPDQMDPTLVCSVGVTSGSDLTYCCLSGLTFGTSTCAQDDSVKGCTGGSYGFSCAAGDTPDMTDSTLVCSTPIPSGSSDLFCCLSTQYAWTAGSCDPNATVDATCTTPGSFGFKCQASDTPDQTDPTLNCSTGVVNADGTTDFCCL